MEKDTQIQNLTKTNKKFETEVKLFNLVDSSLKDAMKYNEKLKIDLENSVQKYNKSQILIR